MCKYRDSSIQKPPAVLMFNHRKTSTSLAELISDELSAKQKRLKSKTNNEKEF